MEPLVSIMIPNYNHARYLADSIRSAINQTYENLEIVVLDNASDDGSILVAEQFISDPRVRICRNATNCFNRSYRILSDILTTGKYLILLCADDVIYPDFVENAVEIMEKNPRVGYVHGEKDVIYDDGKIGYWDPFYKCSFVAPGRNAMPIYMVTTVAHPSQGIIRRDAFRSIDGYDREIWHMNADRALWYYLSYDWDVAYIREKSCGIHIGAQTETSLTIKNAQHMIQSHLTILDFIKFAENKGLDIVYGRKHEALNRLASEFVGYAAAMAVEGDIEKADSYLKYAFVVSHDVAEREEYKTVNEGIHQGVVDKDKLKKLYKIDEQKKRGYEPPEGFIVLKSGEDYACQKRKS